MKYPLIGQKITPEVIFLQYIQEKTYHKSVLKLERNSEVVTGTINVYDLFKMHPITLLFINCIKYWLLTEKISECKYR